MPRKMMSCHVFDVMPWIRFVFGWLMMEKMMSCHVSDVMPWSKVMSYQVWWLHIMCYDFMMTKWWYHIMWYDFILSQFDICHYWCHDYLMSCRWHNISETFLSQVMKVVLPCDVVIFGVHLSHICLRNPYLIFRIYSAVMVYFQRIWQFPFHIVD